MPTVMVMECHCVHKTSEASSYLTMVVTGANSYGYGMPLCSQDIRGFLLPDHGGDRCQQFAYILRTVYPPVMSNVADLASMLTTAPLLHT